MYGGLRSNLIRFDLSFAMYSYYFLDYIVKVLMEGPLKNNYVEGQPSLNEWNENENEWLVNSISENLTFSPENVENVSIRPWKDYVRKYTQT